MRGKQIKRSRNTDHLPEARRKLQDFKNERPAQFTGEGPAEVGTATRTAEHCLEGAGDVVQSCSVLSSRNNRQ